MNAQTHSCSLCWNQFPALASGTLESAILTAVRDHAPVSRSRIGDIAAVPASQVSRGVGALLDRGILLEQAHADQSGPRRKKGLAINPQAGHALAVSYDAAGLEGAILNGDYEPVHTDARRVDLRSLPADAVLDHIITFAQSLQARAKRLKSPPLGLALIDPGLVDVRTGRAVWAGCLTHWHDVPVATALHEKLALPIMLTNSLLSMVRAVDRQQGCDTVDDLLYIEYGDGIGCGMKLEGRYIRGASQMAGEFGHLRVSDQNVPCTCGQCGCLEAVAGLSALVRQARHALDAGTVSSLAEVKPLTGTAILTAAGQGDTLAVRLVTAAMDHLAVAVAGLINLLDPDRIIFSQRLSAVGDSLLERFFHAVVHNASGLHPGAVDLRISSLASHVSARGGASAILDRCYAMRS